MGQIAGKVSNIFRCNLAAIQMNGSKASTKLENNEVWLVDSTNSLTTAYSGVCDSYIVGDGNTVASSLEIKKIDQELLDRISNVESMLETPENISDNYNSYLLAYMNANNGSINAQAESTNRKLFLYKVLAGEKYKITGTLAAMGNTTYTYIGFYAGATAPVAGNTGVVIEAYAVAQKTVDREIKISTDGWLIIGTTTLNQERRWNGCDWQVYKINPVDYQSQIDANTESITELDGRVNTLENQIPLSQLVVSDDYDSYIWAYMNATNGIINAQDESTNRRLLLYRVLAGEKYIVTGELPAANAVYTYVGFYAGDAAPVAGNTGTVIEAYAATQKSVNRDINIQEDGWLIVGMYSSTIYNRYQDTDWQVYKITPVDFQVQIDANTESISSLNGRVGTLESQSQISQSIISDEHDSYLWAYMNATNGSINAQDASTNRKLFLYRVLAGEKYRVTGELIAANAVYTFIGFYAGEIAPVAGNTGTVIEAYAATAKSVDREIAIQQNGWLILGMYSNTMEYRYYDADWQVYKIEPVNNAIGGIYLPKKITAVVGDTLQIFKRSLFKGINSDEYDIKTTCTQGKDFPRYWELTPSSASNITVNFKISNYKRQILADSSTNLTIKAAPSNPATTKRIAVFGDSLTQAGTWVAEAARRLLSSDAATATMPAGKGLSNIKFIGAMGTGNARYYGVGGWSWKSYCVEGNPAFRFQVTGVSTIVKGAKYTNNGFTYEVVENNTTNGSGNILCTTSAATNTPTSSGTLTRSSGTGDATITFTSAAADAANPLWDGTGISFSRYLTNIGESSMDCVIFFLGWNDMGADKKNFSEIEGYMETLISALHTQYPNTIVKIMGLQLPSLNGGLAENYGANGGYADKYGVIRSVFAYNEFLQSFCESEDYNSYVSYVDVATQFDSENNMPETSVQVNTRNAKTEERGTNGVHPANAGYYQIADVVYRDVVKTYC